MPFRPVVPAGVIAPALADSRTVAPLTGTPLLITCTWIWAVAPQGMTTPGPTTVTVVTAVGLGDGVGDAAGEHTGDAVNVFVCVASIVIVVWVGHVALRVRLTVMLPAVVPDGVTVIV